MFSFLGSRDTVSLRLTSRGFGQVGLSRLAAILWSHERTYMRFDIFKGRPDFRLPRKLRAPVLLAECVHQPTVVFPDQRFPHLTTFNLWGTSSHGDSLLIFLQINVATIRLIKLREVTLDSRMRWQDVLKYVRDRMTLRSARIENLRHVLPNVDATSLPKTRVRRHCQYYQGKLSTGHQSCLSDGSCPLFCMDRSAAGRRREIQERRNPHNIQEVIGRFLGASGELKVCRHRLSNQRAGPS